MELLIIFAVEITNKTKKMAQLTNIKNIEVGDTIVLTYNSGSTKNMLVTRVEAKSWYSGISRNSYGTLERLLNNSGDIVKSEIIKGN